MLNTLKLKHYTLCLNYRVSRNISFLKSLQKFVTFSKQRVGQWKYIKLPPFGGQKLLKNYYIPLSKRFLYREIVSDSSLIDQANKNDFELMANYINEKISENFIHKTSEVFLLFQQLQLQNISASKLSSSGELNIPSDTNRRQRLDHEYWFLRKLSEVALDGGFVEMSQEALQQACQQTLVRGSRIKTFVDPSDYDVLRVWTRGLHPFQMFHINRSLKSVPTNNPPPDTKFMLNWISKLTNLLTSCPKASALLTKDKLCYGHVLIAFRLKQDDILHIRMSKQVPVSSKSASNFFAEGVVDLLPEHRYIGLSNLSKTVVYASTAIALTGLGIVTPLAYLIVSNSDMVFAWSLSAASISLATSMAVWLRYWKLRSDWCENLRRLSLACEFNSGSFALKHLLSLSQSELFKASLLAYSLLLRPSANNTPLNRNQLEVRAESWISRRLTPKDHIALPSSTNSSPIFTLTQKNFTGGSGPLFDLVFDSRPALQLLRELNLVRGPDDKLEAVVLNRRAVLTSNGKERSLINKSWMQPDPNSNEEDLAVVNVSYRQ